MTTKILETPNDSQDLIRRAAFRLLLLHSEPIGVEELAAATGPDSASHRIGMRSSSVDAGSARGAHTTSSAALERLAPAAAHSLPAPVRERLRLTSSAVVP